VAGIVESMQMFRVDYIRHIDLPRQRVVESLSLIGRDVFSNVVFDVCQWQ
jgi:hypothetical protein